MRTLRPASALVSKLSRQRRNRLQRRNLKLEQLEARELMALLSSGSGDGHLQVQVNEYGAFGRNGRLEVTTVQNPNGPREVDDAFYDPVGTALQRAGTTFESALAIKVGGDPVTFLTDGLIANRGNFENGTFQVPLDPNNRILNSTFYYPNTIGTNGQGAQLRIDLQQEIIIVPGPGTTPLGVTLRQTYTVTNLSGSPLDVEIWRYYDGDERYDGSFTNDGAGMRQVIVGNPEFVWMTNQATNTNRNDVSYVEIRSDPDGIVRPDRWEVGRATGSVVVNGGACLATNPCKNRLDQLNNGALVDKIINDVPLADDIIPTNNDLDGNNKVDNGQGNDWAVALRNFYNLPGGANTVYVTETAFGNPEIGDPEPPVIPNPQRGTVSGTKFSDANANGTRDPGEIGVGGFRIYADVNNNSTFDSGEPSAISDSNGFYNLVLDVGTYTVREVPQANWTQTFPAAGSYSVTIAAAGDFLPGRDFGNNAVPGSVSGRIFEDFNRNGRLDGGEGGLITTVYADINNNGVFDPTEPNTTSAAGTGTYTIANLDPRTYSIRQVVPSGYDQTFPSNNSAQVVTVGAAQNISGVNFGNAARPGSVNGKVTLDTNGNGAIDPSEPGASGVIVYLDRDNNCNIGLGENAIVTDSRGTFGVLGVLPGEYIARLALPAGFDQVLPAGGPCAGGIPVTVGPGGSITGVNFLVTSLGLNGATKDFGDAPANYPVTLAQNGARHTVTSNFGLGVGTADTETDGQASPFANADDFSLSDDEDGVQFLDPLRRGQTANIRVVVQTGSKFAGKLQGWIDFNGDGDWNDPGEWVIRNSDNANYNPPINYSLPTGTHIIPITVPAGANTGRVFARFRYGYEFDLQPTGDAGIGEVEDYSVFIVGANPDAVNDSYTLNDAAATVTLDVLANDTPSENGDGIITSVNTTGTTGAVTISADGLTIQYTPSGTSANDSFTYTITDPAGNTDTATVFITVTLPPVAVDDAFINLVQPAPAGGFPLDVLANDIAGLAPLTIVSTSTGSVGGTVTIASGGQSLLYTPSSGAFQGTETFTYTVVNGSGLTSTAEVTVVVTPGNTANDLVELELALLKLDGTPLDDNIIGPGQMFKVRVSTDDLRTASPLPPPTEARGVFAAYLDLLYDASRFEVVAQAGPDFNATLGFNIVFGSAYPAGQTGNEAVPGIINEVGAFQNTGSGPLGPNPITLFTVTLRAKPLPTGSGPLTGFITTDPADVSPDSDVLLFEPPLPVVSVDQLTLSQVSLVVDPNEPVDNSANGPAGEAVTGGSTIGGGNSGATPGAGTSKHQNLTNRFDVSADGAVSPLDALLIINSLNSQGPRSLASATDPALMSSPMYLDVDGNGYLSPVDALLVITRINATNHVGGEAAAAASSSSSEVSTAATSETATAPAATSKQAVAAPPSSSTSSSTSSNVTADDDTDDILSLAVAGSSVSMLPVDMVLAGPVQFGNANGSSEEDDEMDDLFAELAQDACFLPRQ